MTWYQNWFNHIYLRVYAHRNTVDAQRLLRLVIDEIPSSQSSWILDCGCGNGRHTIELAKKGYSVIGIDLSKDLLAVAKRAARKAKLTIPFVRGDMQNLPFSNASFGTVLSLFTSFGYFDDIQNMQTINHFARILQPGGFFVLDYLNVEYVEANLVAMDQQNVGEYEVIQERQIHQNRIEKTITINHHQETQTFFESVRLYSFQELIDLLKNVNIEVYQSYGNYGGDAYHPTAERMILFGRKQ